MREGLAMVDGSIIVSGVAGAGLALSGKIVWDWIQSGRIKQGDYYVTVKKCDQIRKECCVSKIKTDFQAHKENDGRHDADTDSRLKVVEQELRDGREDFKTIRADITAINLSLKQISTILEIRWGNGQKQINANS